MRHLTSRGLLPATIIIGIASRQHTHEYTAALSVSWSQIVMTAATIHGNASVLLLLRLESVYSQPPYHWSSVGAVPRADGV